MPENIIESKNAIRELTLSELEVVAGRGTGPANVAPRPSCPCGGEGAGVVAAGAVAAGQA
jgi:hypothetical protein